MKEGWVVKPLGDVLQTTVTRNPLLSPDTEFEYIDVSSVSNQTFKIEKTQRLLGRDAPSRARRLVQAGDILFATIRPTLMRIAMVPEELNNQVCSTGYYVLKPQPEVYNRFLFYWLFSETFSRRMEQLQKGASYPAVNDTDVRSQKIAFPSLTEQQRIVAKLDEAFEAIASAKEKAEQNLLNARALFDSYLSDVFSKRGEDWVETTLGTEVDLQVGFAFKSAGYSTNASDMRLLRGDNIIQGTTRWDDVKRWPLENVMQYENYKLQLNDIVLAMDRPWVKSGLKRAQINKFDIPSLLVQRTARLRVGTSLDADYLYFLISSESFIKYIIGGQTGIGVPHISGQQIKDFIFSRPPTKQQKNIVSKLRSLEELINQAKDIYQQKIYALDELKQSLLHQAFSGEL